MTQALKTVGLPGFSRPVNALEPAPGTIRRHYYQASLAAFDEAAETVDITGATALAMTNSQGTDLAAALTANTNGQFVQVFPPSDWTGASIVYVDTLSGVSKAGVWSPPGVRGPHRDRSSSGNGGTAREALPFEINEYDDADNPVDYLPALAPLRVPLITWRPSEGYVYYRGNDVTWENVTPKTLPAFDTRGDLLASLEVRAGDKVFVKSRDALGDGGDGWYEILAAAPAGWAADEDSQTWRLTNQATLYAQIVSVIKPQHFDDITDLVGSERALEVIGSKLKPYTKADINGQSLAPQGEVSITQPVTIRGPGEITVLSANHHILSVRDEADFSRIIDDVSFFNLKLANQPAGGNNDHHALMFHSARCGIAAFNRFDTVDGGISFQYSLDQPGNLFAAASIDGLAMGNAIKNTRHFGMHIVSSKYSRVLGNVVQNDDFGGVKGSHALRIAGSFYNAGDGDSMHNRGTVALGNIFRSKGNGVSLQRYAYGATIVGNYIEACDRGLTSSYGPLDYAGVVYPSEGKQGHFVTGFIARDSVNEGAMLDYLQGGIYDLMINGTGGHGIDMRNSVEQDGKNNIRGMVNDAGDRGISVDTDRNMMVLTINDAQTASAIINGNKNLIIVQANDGVGAIDISLNGDDNVLVLSGEGSGTVSHSIVIGGDRNHVSGNFAHNVNVNGDDNVLDGIFHGTLRVNASATNTTISGRALSTFLDLSTTTKSDGLNTGVLQSNKGVFSGATSATGTIAIPHGLASAPPNVQTTLATGGGLSVSIDTIDATNVNLIVYDASGAVLNAQAVSLHWRVDL